MGYSENFFALREQKKKKNANNDVLVAELEERWRDNNAKEEDIAPVRKTTKEAPFDPIKATKVIQQRQQQRQEEAKKNEKKVEVFKKSTGNVAQTILGTVGDTALNVAKGWGNLWEGVADTITYAAAGMEKFRGDEESAALMKKAAQMNANELATLEASDYIDQYSVLGRSAKSVAQGIGQVGGMILTGGAGAATGLGTAGTTALTSSLMGLSSTGSGIGEAYEAGATDAQAATYGILKGAVDAGSEMIFGGLGKTVKALGLSKGLSSLDDVFARKLSNKIANTAVRNLVEFGVKASAEGAEEVIAGIGSAAAKKLTYMSDKELKELVKDENLLEQFIVGTVTSGLMQSGLIPGTRQGSLIEANKAGIDFIDGLTENEQKVVDAEFEKRTEGKDLTKKEQNKIYNDVLSDMAKGYISTDTIESVLGGESYKTYKDTIDNKKALQDEYDKLYKMKNGEKSDEQIDRQADLKKQLEELNKTDTNELKTKLGEEVLGIVKDSRLAESYNEKTRRSQAFKADVSKYDEKQRATIQKAIDSGILNNTNKTHDFVDMIAKISADKGVPFDFINNAKLKESGFALEGKVVDGFVTKDGIKLNIDSNRAMNTVVGHEITHVLEGTELYTELQNIITEYAKNKGDYQGRYDAIAKLYEGIEGADINTELTAELVGEYLFTDTDFINNLSANHRNVFQKIYDEIKYLLKVATAGSKEARQLEMVKRAFEKAYKEGNANIEGTKYTISEIVGDSGKSYGIGVKLDSTLLENLTESERKQMVKARVVEELAGNSFVAYDGETPVEISLVEKNEKITNANGKKKQVLKELYNKHIGREIKQEAVVLANELIEASENAGAELAHHPHDWLDNNGENNWDERTVYIQDKNNTVWNATLQIANSTDGRKILYDIDPIKMTEGARKSAPTTVTNTVTQPSDIVKPSLSDTDTRYVGKFLASDLRLEAPAEVTEKGIAPVKETAKQNTAQPTAAEKQQIAKILSEEPTKENRKSRLWARFKTNFLDKGAVFEDLSYKTKNRSLMEKWNYTLSSEARAQHLIGNGAKGVKSLNAIMDEVGDNSQAFAEYLYHKHNVDRMSLAERYPDSTNKPVFGDSVTSIVSRDNVRHYEKSHPEFIKYAEDVYAFNRHLRQLLVEGGVISQKTADLWEEMYPHFVPIRRKGDTGLNINVPLDTRKTGVNAPVKKATGGSRDILPLFDTMAQRTIQTYKAIAKNKFGVELKNTLGSTVSNDASGVDDVIESIDAQEGLLQAAKNGKNPTFTVFENGERVTFEITEDMYDALKPVSAGLATTIKPLKALSSVQRGLLTEYNPVFMLTNAIKDAQDVLINSQHPLKTYAKVPEAFAQLLTKGYWYEEYMKSGGEDNTYFDKQTDTFDTESKGLKKILDLPPFNWVSAINNYIERVPRLAEYIASREAGKSVEGAMLDAARVTTNFAAGGDVTKFLNRNGATFLNASVQGAMQQVRNIRDAKANGLKGWVNLATKFAIAGIPAIILNNLVWDDDEEYEELSDYVKQNYYVVAKTDDGKFVRIPKGRTLAVIQNALLQISNAATGNDEVDLKAFLELAVSNLAPNNPIDNNVVSPIKQVLENETWYGEKLVPTRLQDLPAAEQFDESTDSLSKWLGEKLDISPYKINYLLDQYSGGIGDVLLPMMTPEAESGDTSRLGQLIAPLRDKFTTDATFNNQNVSDFYDKVEELTTNAKASAATDEDILKNKYMNAVNSEVSDLYKKKREIQNSNLSDTAKYKQVKDVQKQITDIMRDALGTYDNIRYENGKEFAIIGDTYFQWYKPEDGDAYWRKLSEDQVTKHKVTYAAGDVAYATNGKVHYRLNEGGDWRNMSDWTKISDKDLARQKEVTKELGITPEEYWSKTEVSYFPMKEGEYEYAYENPENYAVAKAVGGYDAYKGYSKDLYNLKADKDANGKSISGSRKKKVAAYINNLNVDYGAKLILYKSEYPSDDRYNYEIIEYLNNNDDIGYDDMVKILTELSFKVDGKGNISWD